MSIYPIRLIPKNNYKQISTEVIFFNCFFLTRYTPDTNYFEDGQERIKVRHICSPTENIGDLSMSLLGTFKDEDNKIEIIDNKSYFHDDWDYEREVAIPLINSSYDFKNDRGRFFLNLKKVHNHSVPEPNSGIESDFVIKCKIVHKPTNCNYWHFQFQWEDQDGNIIDKTNKAWKKKVGTTARASICHLADTKNPCYLPFPKFIYQRKISDKICVSLNRFYNYTLFQLLVLNAKISNL